MSIYYRGGAILKDITHPGYNLMLPLITSVHQIQTTMQTDEIRNIPCGMLFCFSCSSDISKKIFRRKSLFQIHLYRKIWRFSVGVEIIYCLFTSWTDFSTSTGFKHFDVVTGVFFPKFFGYRHYLLLFFVSFMYIMSNFRCGVICVVFFLFIRVFFLFFFVQVMSTPVWFWSNETDNNT